LVVVVVVVPLQFVVQVLVEMGLVLVGEAGQVLLVGDKFLC